MKLAIARLEVDPVFAEAPQLFKECVKRQPVCHSKCNREQLAVLLRDIMDAMRQAKGGPALDLVDWELLRDEVLMIDIDT